MKVNIKTIDNKPLFYETEGACAFDFKASEDIEIPSMEARLVETGTVIETPKEVVLQISPRSSTFKNYNLILVNSIGIIDNDYSGNTDTIKFNYFNLSKEKTIIKKGDRIGQGMFVSLQKAEFNIVKEMNDQNRGGFGTTGK